MNLWCVSFETEQCSTLVKKTAHPQDGLLSDIVRPDKKLSARTFSVMGYLSLRKIAPGPKQKGHKT